MESNSKLSTSFRKVPAVDVSRLDKINAFPNKTTGDVLLSDLSPDDLHYINALMDSDSSSGSDDEESSMTRSAWSPMVQRPVRMNKSIKKLKPSYAITLSLEDISYIRPSWGISKGIRSIELNRRKKAPKFERKEESKKSNPNDIVYRYFLILLSVIVLFLTVPAYLLEKRKEHATIESNRFKIELKTSTMEFYKPLVDSLDLVLKVQFAQGIPSNLKPDRCTCEIYSAESERYTPNVTIEDRKSCISCINWAFRSNMRVYMAEKNLDGSNCYDIKWQSYDALITPIVDCFFIEDEHWFGLGDIQNPLVPLNKLQFDWTPLVSNLTSDFRTLRNSAREIKSEDEKNQIEFGSFVAPSLFTTKGVIIGNFQTDFEISLKVMQDLKLGVKKMCISVACTDRCTQTWFRSDHLDEFRYKNNILEYRICTSHNSSALLARRFTEIAQSSKAEIGKTLLEEREKKLENIINNRQISKSDKLIEREETVSVDISRLSLHNTKEEVKRELPEGIGLIERTIFITSQEFMPVLNGQTLRQHVDNIVKLGLKASSILLIDTRWETYIGSLKLNTAAFPKAKLLFEILHNKGFKILFMIKPYVDTGIGISNVNQLFTLGRLYTANYQSERRSMQFPSPIRRSASGIKETVVRRQSLFSFKNQTIEIGTDESNKIPYIFECKESSEGYCALIDLTRASNRQWLISNIMRSGLLTTEADGFQISGAHSNSFMWDDHYREGVSKLVKDLFLREKRYTLPQWVGAFGYIQLSPRHCNWDALKSSLNSILNLGMIGFSLIHPGSVWGDLKSSAHASAELTVSSYKSPNRINTLYGETQPHERSNEELVIRWLQISMFLPILQFNDISPVEKYGLQELVQNLTRIRKLYIVPELKKNLPFTPLVDLSKQPISNNLLPLIRPVWYNLESGYSMVPEQFTIGADILIAPILGEGLRQRDIYLPGGFWHDELRQINLRGGKWLRNYPIELNEIAWFSRAKR